MARRKRFFELHLMGIPHPVIIKELQEKYGGSVGAYYKDWERRSEWLPLLVSADPNNMAKELIAEVHAARSRLWLMAVNTSIQDSVRLGAFKLLQEGIGREIELLQSLGSLPKMAERFEQTVMTEEHITFDVPEDEASILEAAERILNKRIQRQEKPTQVH